MLYKYNMLNNYFTIEYSNDLYAYNLTVYLDLALKMFRQLNFRHLVYLVEDVSLKNLQD